MGFVGGCALAVLAVGAGPAAAAWNNVFQVACFGCRNRTTTAYASPIVAAAPGCPQPCPQQQCTTRYVQRSYYQPVTTYRTSCYLEPVTTFKTSFYYEPVTSYRYSCYFDPCTCRYQQIAQPVTSFRLRSQTCPVTSYLQRTALVPVTTYQQAFYWEPQTTCCQTTVGAPIFGQPPSVNGVPGGAVPPNVSDQRTNPVPNPPSVGEDRQQLPGNTESRRFNPAQGQEPPLAPEGKNNAFRQPRLQAPLPVQNPTAVPPANVRIDRIAAAPDHNVQGQVVNTDKAPRAGARVMFVSADRQRTQRNVTADDDGKFRVTLASGGWLVYVHGPDGKLEFQEKIDVQQANEPRQMTLTSR
jgi:hypothetical protein